MNAAPHSALATVCMPRHHPRLQSRDLHRLMAGALKELNAARCTLVGGHTIEGPQMAAGFTVNGAAPPADLWHKSGARPGDAILEHDARKLAHRQRRRRHSASAGVALPRRATRAQVSS